MKAIQTKLLAFGGIALLLLAACKKNDAIVTSNGGKPGALSASTVSLTLDRTKVADTSSVITFNFSNANYGFNAAVTNTLQIDVPADNWAKPASATLATKVYSQGYATAVFNKLLLQLGLPGGAAAQIQVRVVHSISSAVAPVYSNVLSLTVTPFNLASSLYIVGGYQGWSPGSADSLVSPTSNGVYNGLINFTAGSGNNNFKVLLNKQNYNNSYGYAATLPSGTLNLGNDNLTVTNESVTQASGGGNLFSLTAPSDDAAVNITANFVTLDVNKNTISLVPMQWGVVGDASPGGWPNGSGTQSDTNMKFDATNQVWYVNTHLTAGGNIKFRLNHDWGYNLGGTNGTLSGNNGPNIPIATTGNYLVTMDLVHNTYSIQ